MSKELKSECMASVGFSEGSPEDKVTELTLDIARLQYKSSNSEWTRKERREWKRSVKNQVIARVKEDPKSYGFVGALGWIILLFRIGSIVNTVLQWLLSRDNQND